MNERDKKRPATQVNIPDLAMASLIAVLHPTLGILYREGPTTGYAYVKDGKVCTLELSTAN